MTLENIYYIASIVAALAVVVTIVFLSIQIRLNTKAIRAASEYEAETRWADINFGFAYNEDRAAFGLRHLDASIDPASLDDVEQARAQFMVRAMFQNYQSYYYLYTSGSLPKSAWEHHLVWARQYINLPIVKTLLDMEIKQGLFRPEFLAELHREKAIPVDLSLGRTVDGDSAE